MQARRLGPIALLLIVSFTPRTRADVLRFASGGRVELPIETRGSLVVLKAPGGEVAFPRDDFREILPAPTPSEEWPGASRTPSVGASPSGSRPPGGPSATA